MVRHEFSTIYFQASFEKVAGQWYLKEGPFAFQF